MAPTHARRVVIAVRGMTCAKCERLITECAEEHPGVRVVAVSKDQAAATVVVVGQQDAGARIEALVRDIGKLVNGKFKASVVSVEDVEEDVEAGWEDGES